MAGREETRNGAVNGNTLDNETLGVVFAKGSTTSCVRQPVAEVIEQGQKQLMLFRGLQVPGLLPSSEARRQFSGPRPPMIET